MAIKQTLRAVSRTANAKNARGVEKNTLFSGGEFLYAGAARYRLAMQPLEQEDMLTACWQTGLRNNICRERKKLSVGRRRMGFLQFCHASQPASSFISSLFTLLTCLSLHLLQKRLHCHCHLLSLYLLCFPPPPTSPLGIQMGRHCRRRGGSRGTIMKKRMDLLHRALSSQAPPLVRLSLAGRWHENAHSLYRTALLYAPKNQHGLALGGTGRGHRLLPRPQATPTARLRFPPPALFLPDGSMDGLVAGRPANGATKRLVWR